MKYMIASDIHGSAYYCRQMLRAFESLHCDRLILLGDLLYHGPRNDLPREYAPKEVISLLNSYASKLLCVRGNCEAEVDQMVLHFPCLADYAVLEVDGKLLYLTHGHKNELLYQQLAGTNSIVLLGHTHVPKIETIDGITRINPGSVSIPKENSAHSYLIFENGEFVFGELSSVD